MNETRDQRQDLVGNWAERCFGVEEATNLPQRGLRLAEEAIETAQAAGTDQALIHKLVDYVYNRPVGDLKQEVGGVHVTLLALCHAAGIYADLAEKDEVNRILSKPAAHFRQRNAVKNDAGFREDIPVDECSLGR